MELSPQKIWSKYEKGQMYLNRNNVYETVKTNEKFYEGNQWDGLEASNMPKPVFNVLQRAGKFMVATIGSNDIAITMTPFTEVAEDIARMSPVAKAIENVIEIARIKEASKIIIRNAFVDGAGYMMQTFDPDFETGQDAKGILENQIIDNTNIYFGNPYSNNIQKQPYIIVALRQHISQVKKEAKESGVPYDQIELINAENDNLQLNDDSDDLVTVLITYYKEKNEQLGYDEIWFTKTTKEVTIKKPTNLGYRRYPISCFGWDLNKNSYIYTSPMTSVIPNQIFINKVFAIAQMYGVQSVFPKIVFDKSKVDIEGFMNTNATAVAGIDMMGKFLDFIKVPDFSNNVIELALQTIAQTKECMGVTDASLGNVKADNTSAIIALQESSAVPLEIQKQAFYEFWEDTVRNIIDIVACSYGERWVMTDEAGLAFIDFNMLRNINFNLKVEIGNGAQFSEIAQVNTLDKLVQAGYITPDAYMKAVPSKYIPQKEALLQSYYQMIAQGQTPTPRGSLPIDESAPI